MLTINREPCPNCGCLAFESDPIDGLVCLLCARPLRPFISTARYMGKREEKIDATIERERRVIAADIAAGRRVWS